MSYSALNTPVSSMDLSAFTKAFGNSFMLTIRDWPLWGGFAIVDYVTTTLQRELTGQSYIVQALGNGLATTVNMEYFYAYKFPSQATTDLNKAM